MLRLIPSVRPLLYAGVALGSLAAAPAFAQAVQVDDDTVIGDSETGDIVVTARRREERLLDVPVAVTAISANTLEKLQATDLSGIQGTVPNVNLVQGRGSTSNANIFIRGIGQPDALQTFDPAVGIYVDGVYMSRIQGALFGLFDVERVEVLRGPQGTLYGKNTVGGAVNVVTRKPDTVQFRAAGSATYGSYDQILLNGYVSAPLVTDKLALSLAGVYDKRDGVVIDPLTGRDYNDRNSWAARGILRATPSENVELILSGDYYKQRNAAALGQATAPLTGLLGFPVLKPAYPYGRTWNYRASTSLAPGQGQRVDHWGVSFTGNIELSDALTFTSITGYRKLSPDYYLDFDATELEVSDAFVGVRQEQFSQELQLKYDSGPLSGVFGLYYLNEDVTSHQEAYSDNLVYLAPAGPPLTFTRFIDDEQNTKSYAAFGQVTYDFTDQFSATAGLRYSKERKRYHRVTSTVTGGVTGGFYEYPNSLPAPFNGIDHVDFDAWTPTLSLSFKPTRDTLLYASASRGFKSGGFNGRVNGVGDVTQVIGGVPTIVPFFEPETVWTYEGGAKGSFLDGRVTMAATGFYSTYQDFQARVGGGSAGAFPVVNAGELRIWGIEFEAAVRPVREWSIRTSFGYLNADYEEFNDGRRAPAYSCNPTGSAIVCEPPFAPPISFSLASDYAIPLGNAGSLTLGGDARFVDKHYLSIDNRPGLIEDGYWLVNAFVQFDAAGGKYYLRGGVKNLTKSIYKTDGQEFSSIGNIQTAYYGDPRTWSVTAGFRF
ncbi:TonB-dependent receptor [Sphingomonas turrisvirgatae]|uniref:TonB-dependent receptor n=1 Tax=Sphingomonas turrisvirgatae TaxID=1888892 RepID=A0A1E3LZC4_9SPHN|nr:TonB-dependent receptor [Sphingomonas turrisvirgatae]ODP39068.1 TonB-dependent receptor [Sphingomonas turrisvirgatae]